MQGMRFLILDQNGTPFNHGIIAKEITPEKYLCHFSRVPASARVCDITEIQGWNLFPTDEAMNVFIAALKKGDPSKLPASPETPSGKPIPPVKKKTKKKVGKKKVSKKKEKSNGKG